MHRPILFACALALTAAWAVGPASAADVKDKAVETKDTVKDKAVETKDTVKDKAVETKDTIKEKAVEAKDTIKDKAHRAKEKMSSKMHREGRTGDRVAMTDTRAAQEALKTQGFDPGPVDGRMGPRTRAAISDYQRRENLPVTGMLDSATMAKLNVRSSRADEVPAASPTTRPDEKKQNP
jgi:peptidoglycan hydrolase-like protein with peptidoglycan-binding domain